MKQYRKLTKQMIRFIKWTYYSHHFVLLRNIQNRLAFFLQSSVWNADSHSGKQEGTSLTLPISGYHICLTSPPPPSSPPYRLLYPSLKLLPEQPDQHFVAIRL